MVKGDAQGIRGGEEVREKGLSTLTLPFIDTP